jgi:hypothetical protein
MKGDMRKTTEELAKALVRLEGERDYQTVKTWLGGSFKDELIGNIDLRGEDAVRHQGYAEALRDIMAVIDEPRRLAEKFKK